MKMRILVGVVLAGVLAMSGMAFAPASADCEGPGDNGGRDDGNEIVGVYVEDVPVDAEVAGHDVRVDNLWVEVQDNGEELPVAVEAGYRGGRTPGAGPVPGLSGAHPCSDDIITGFVKPLLPE